MNENSGEFHTRLLAIDEKFTLSLVRLTEIRVVEQVFDQLAVFIVLEVQADHDLSLDLQIKPAKQLQAPRVFHCCSLFKLCLHCFQQCAAV